jgi:hypothetical protein
MKNSLAPLLCALPVLLLCSCPLPTSSPVSGVVPQPAASGATLSLATDESRNQALLVVRGVPPLDIAAQTDDGTKATAVEAEALAEVRDPGQSLSAGRQAIIIGTRSNGQPGVWAYSNNGISAVIDEESGNLTSVLPECADHQGTFTGRFGWQYILRGVSEDGMLIAGYAVNPRGISHGRYKVEAGTTIGVYWRVSRHPHRPFFRVSRAHVIGTLDLSRVPGGNGGHRRLLDRILKKILDQLKLYLTGYFSSYLTMVEKDGVHLDAVNPVYLVTGTDQDGQPATATIDRRDRITITPVAGPASTVYAAGYWYNGSTNDVASSWQDDAAGRVDLFTAAEAIATSVLASGSDVYVAGYYKNARNNWAAALWKNGAKTDLFSDTSGSNTAQASAVCISGTDVYVAGYEKAGTGAAGYWKNGAWVALAAPGDAQATGITVSGSDVYVSGYYLSGTFNVACYWKNGAQTNLYTANDSKALALSVSGTDVYVAGYYFDGTSVNGCYWRNNSAGVTVLNSSAAFATGIVVSGSNVYASGYFNNARGNPSACSWRNGTQTILYSDTAGTGTAHANGIFLSGTDVYVAGWVNTGTQSACFWKNGARTDLYTSNSSDARSVFVVK